MIRRCEIYPLTAPPTGKLLSGAISKRKGKKSITKFCSRIDLTKKHTHLVFVNAKTRSTICFNLFTIFKPAISRNVLERQNNKSYHHVPFFRCWNILPPARDLIHAFICSRILGNYWEFYFSILSIYERKASFLVLYLADVLKKFHPIFLFVSCTVFEIGTLTLTFTSRWLCTWSLW